LARNPARSYVAVQKQKIDENLPIELKVKIAVKGKKFVGELKFEGYVSALGG
jgi:hypothetical protein